MEENGSKFGSDSAGNSGRGTSVRTTLDSLDDSESVLGGADAERRKNGGDSGESSSIRHSLTMISRSADSTADQKRMVLDQIDALFKELRAHKQEVLRILPRSASQPSQEDVRVERRRELTQQEVDVRRERLERAIEKNPEVAKWMSIVRSAKNRVTEFADEINRQVHVDALGIFARLEGYPNRSVFLDYLTREFAVRCNRCISAETQVGTAELQARRVLAQLWQGVVSHVRTKLAGAIPGFSEGESFPAPPSGSVD